MLITGAALVCGVATAAGESAGAPAGALASALETASADPALSGLAFAASVLRAAASGWAAFSAPLLGAAIPRSSSSVGLSRSSVWSAALACGGSSSEGGFLPSLLIAASVLPSLLIAAFGLAGRRFRLGCFLGVLAWSRDPAKLFLRGVEQIVGLVLPPWPAVVRRPSAFSGPGLAFAVSAFRAPSGWAAGSLGNVHLGHSCGQCLLICRRKLARLGSAGRFAIRSRFRHRGHFRAEIG